MRILEHTCFVEAAVRQGTEGGLFFMTTMIAMATKLLLSQKEEQVGCFVDGNETKNKLEEMRREFNSRAFSEVGLSLYLAQQLQACNCTETLHELAGIALRAR